MFRRESKRVLNSPPCIYSCTLWVVATHSVSPMSVQLVSSSWLAVLGSLAALVILTRRFSGRIYDAVIVRMTARWYAAVLAVLPPGSRVLDVGVGTGSALARNAAALRDRRVRVVGIDYDAPYIARARRVVATAGLMDRVALECCSIFDAALPARLAAGSPRSV